MKAGELRRFTPGGSHTGTSGFTNYSGAQPPLAKVWKEFPNSVVVDGDDDWYADVRFQPPQLCTVFGIKPLALYQSGISGITSSGVVLSETGYATFIKLYEERYGVCQLRVHKETR